MTEIASSFLDHIASSVLIVDADGSLSAMNAAAENLIARVTHGGTEAAPLNDESGLQADTKDVLTSLCLINPQHATGENQTEPSGSSVPILSLAEHALRAGKRVSRTGFVSVPALLDERPQALHAGLGGPFACVTARVDSTKSQVVITIEERDGPAEDAAVPTRVPASTSPAPTSPASALPASTYSLATFPLPGSTHPLYVRVLEAMAEGDPVADIAGLACKLVEAYADGLTAAILRYNAPTDTLYHVASPSLDTDDLPELRDGIPAAQCPLCHDAVREQASTRLNRSDLARTHGTHATWDAVFDRSRARTSWTIPIVRDGSEALGVLIFLSDTESECQPVASPLVESVTHLLHAALDRDLREADVREQKERFRQVTETINEVFWLRTADDVLYLSPSFEVIWGRPIADMYADPDAYFEDVHPDDHDALEKACKRLIHDKEPFSMEYRIIRPSDGETRWVRTHFSPVENPSGPARFAGSVRDVTETVESQQRLEMSERTYRNLIDNATDAIYVQDQDGRFLDVSAGVMKMYGYSRGEMLGKTPEFVSAPGKNDLERVKRHIAAAFDGTPQQFEFWGQRADGTVFPKEVRLQRATYFGRSVIVAFALDISTRVAAEEALRESEQRYRLMAKNMKDMVMLHDADGGTLWASPSVKEITGRTPSEAVRLNAFDVIHPDDKERVARHLAHLADGVNRGPTIYRMQHRDGHYVWVETVVRALYGEDGELERIQSASRDVTERKKRQQELRQAKRDAEDADRLKSAMLANMSHEIRTPLTSIIGFAEVLKEEVDPAYRSFAGLIYNSSRRLLRTLDSVLQLSKLEAGIVDLDVSSVCLKQEVEEALELLQPQIQRQDVNVLFDGTDVEDVTGTWDSGALHRVITNLVSNAVKFTEAGGTVRIRVEQAESHVRLSVMDTGIGIDPAFMPHIFEPFQQETGGMRRRHEGSGLGLAIVKRLVDMMGGTIDVESEKGRGTTFVVTLPIH